MDINSLSDDILVEQIISKLPLGAILRLHQVSQRWARLQQQYLATVTYLTVLVGEDDAQHTFGRFTFAIPYIEELAERPQFLTDYLVNHNRNRLNFHWLDVHSARLIADRMPNVTSLTLSLQQVPPMLYRGVRAWGHRTDLTQSLAILFSRWSPFLKSLKYYACFRYDDGDQFTEAMHEHVRFLLGAINSCYRLKHLTFELNNPVYLVQCEEVTVNRDCSSLLRTIDLPVFSWLEDLYFNCWTFSTEALKNLLRYGLKNERLKSINFSDFLQPSFDAFLRKRRFRPLTKRFHQFAYYNLNLSSSESHLIGHHFTAIRRLNVSLQSALEFSQMIAFMGQMENLLYVDLYIYFDNEEQEWKRMANWRELRRKDDEEVVEIEVEEEKKDAKEEKTNDADNDTEKDSEKDSQESSGDVDSKSEDGKEGKEEDTKMENSITATKTAKRNRRNELPLPLQPKVAKSVKILKFYAPQCTHETVHLVRWAECVPSLEVLHLTDRQGCELCRQAVIAVERFDRPPVLMEDNAAERAAEGAHLPNQGINAANLIDHVINERMAAVAQQVDDIWDRCLRQTLQAWTDCPALKKVITNSRDNSNRRWTVEELRAGVGGGGRDLT